MCGILVLHIHVSLNVLILRCIIVTFSIFLISFALNIFFNVGEVRLGFTSLYYFYIDLKTPFEVNMFSQNGKGNNGNVQTYLWKIQEDMFQNL